MKRSVFALIAFSLLLCSCANRELKLRASYDKIVDAIQDEYNEQMMKIQEDKTLLGPEIPAIVQRLDSMASSVLFQQGLKLIRKHPSNPGVEYILKNVYSMAYSPEDVQTLCTVLSKVRGDAAEMEIVKDITASVNARNNTLVGKPFADGALVAMDGSTKLLLSDHVGKGKYVLAAFWASWCLPFLDELPYIKSVQEKYAGEDFEILGIAVIDEPEAAGLAVEQAQMVWPQVLDPDNSLSDAYGIDELPYMILFGPDGTVLSRGFSGDYTVKTVSSALGR